MSQQKGVHFHPALLQPGGHSLWSIHQNRAAGEGEKVAICLGDTACECGNIKHVKGQVWESVGQFKAQTAKSTAINPASKRN
jgi:hypothetical protein